MADRNSSSGGSSAPFATSRFQFDEQVALAASAPFAENAELAYVGLARAILRLQSRTALDVLARLIDPSADTATLVDQARRAVNGPDAARRPRNGTTASDAAVLESARRRSTLAWAVGLLGTTDDDLEAAIALYGHARLLASPTLPLSRTDARALAQMLWLTGRQEELAADDELFGHIGDRSFRAFLEIDLEGARSGVGSERWLSMLNAQLARSGVGPIRLRRDAKTPFDRLESATDRQVVEGPLVTVIMPAFEPGPDIVTAVRSIIDQTWRNLELLVVDDNSGPDYAQLFDGIEGMDPRVRVIHQSVNRGTYAARNRGLDEARGEFVTTQDVDDWSHPERIERQVVPLLEDPHLLRTLSISVRCLDDLTFQYLGYPPLRSNASSHLFRRSLLDEVGQFDWTRKSGDTEFDRRLEAAYPGRRVQLDEILAFVRLQPESLSRGDFRAGWMQPARTEYRAAMFDWHDRVAVGASPHFPKELAARPLTAPRPFLRDTGYPEQPLDIVYAGDWHLDGPSQRAAAEEMRTLAAAGHRVGVLYLRTLRSCAVPLSLPSTAIRRLTREGVVTFVSLEESDHVPTLVVRQPESLEYLPERPVSLTVDRVIVVADAPATSPTDVGPRWTVQDCEHNVQALFGVRPRWWTAREVELDGVSTTMNDAFGDFPDILAPAPRRRPARPRGDRPVVGWITDDDGSGLPATDEAVVTVYPTGNDVDVRLLGGRRAIARRLENVPAQWLVLDEGSVTSLQLWHQVDFAVGFPAASDLGTVQRTALEAMAAGCVVIVPRGFEPAFGDAAVYCDPSEVARVLRRLHADPAAFEAQAARGIARAGQAIAAGLSETLLAALSRDMPPYH